MKIEILLFASLRETCGTERSVVDATAGASVAQIAGDFLAARGIVPASLPPLRYAVNEAFVSGDHAPSEGDRLAVLTPFAGG